MSTLPFYVALHPEKPLTPKRSGQDVSSLTQGSRNSVSQGESCNFCVSELPQLEENGRSWVEIYQLSAYHWLRAVSRALTLSQFHFILWKSQVYSWGWNKARSCRCAHKLPAGRKRMSSASICYDIPVSSYSPVVCSGHQAHTGKSLDFSTCVHFQKDGTWVGRKAVLVSTFYSSPSYLKLSLPDAGLIIFSCSLFFFLCFLSMKMATQGHKPEIFIDYSLTPISKPLPCLPEPLPSSLDFFHSAVFQVYDLFKWEYDATQ